MFGSYFYVSRHWKTLSMFIFLKKSLKRGYKEKEGEKNWNMPGTGFVFMKGKNKATLSIQTN